MSNRAKVLGLMLGAVLAISAITAASASAALPEYQLESGTFPAAFTSTSVKGTLETTSGETVTCTADTNTGELTSAKLGNVTVTFTGCTTTFFGFPISCKSSGKASGVLTGPGGVATEFECAGNTVKVTGSVIGFFPTINTFLNSTELVLKQTKGVQEIKEYINSSGTTVKNVHLSSSKNGGTAVESGETTTDTITLTGGRKVKIAG